MVQNIVNLKFDKILTQLEEFLPKARHSLALGLDHPSVKKVIQVALELTKENKLITSEVLYNRAKRELKIPKWGLNEIIQMLIKNKIIVDGSKFIKLTVLKNKTRNHIYKLIKKHIGAHFSFLKERVSAHKECEIGVSQLLWHLEKLLEFNLIKRVKVKNYIIFMPVEIDNKIGIIYFILRDEINRKIVDYILEQGIINRSDIHNQLDLKREIVYYHIKNLLEYNILTPLIENVRNITINPIKRELLNKIMSKFSTITSY
jgi:predicted transcriptional regulator